MALLTTPQDHGYTVLPYFHIDKAFIAKAKTLKVVIDCPAAGKFQIKYLGKVYGTVEIKGPAMTLAKNGQLGPMSLDSIKGQFNSYLKAAVAEALTDQGYSSLDEVPMTVGGGAPTKKPVDPIKAMLAKKASDAPAVDKIAKSWGTPAEATGAPIDLGEASEPYQVVKGTSASSKYYVLGVFNGMNLAARVQQTGGQYKLSLRAEGDSVKTFDSPLTDMGMDGSVTVSKKPYYSGHYDVDSLANLYKAMGAILGRLGFASAVKMADPAKLVKVCL